MTCDIEKSLTKVKLSDIAQGLGQNESSQLFQKFQEVLSEYDIDYMRKNDVTFGLKQ